MWRGRYRHTGRGTTFVDAERERIVAGLAVAAVIGFLISGWYTFRELRYAVRGNAADARVIRMYEFTEPTRRGRSRPRLRIEYSFTDADGHSRTDKDSVLLPSHLQGAVKLPVEYLPGPDGDSRLVANRSYLGLLTFSGCVAIGALTLGRFIRDANAPIRRGRRRLRSAALSLLH